MTSVKIILSKTEKKHIFFIVPLMLIAGLQVWHLLVSVRNVPFMDYWTYIDFFTEKTFEGGLTFSDIWMANNGSRNVLQYLLFIINMKVFHYDTRIEIYGGFFITICISILLYYYFFKIGNRCEMLSQRKPVQQLLVLPACLAVFNFNQWEISTLEFSFTFALRLYCYLLIFFLLDAFLFDKTKKNKAVIFLSTMIVISILLIAQVYFIAMIGAMFCVLFLDFLLKYHADKSRNLKYYITLAICCFVAVGIYFFDLRGTGQLSFNFLSIDFLKSILIFFGASAYSFSFGDGTSNMHLYIIGLFVVLAYLIAFAFYVRKKIYRYTYIPVLFFLYTFFNLMAIYATRISFGTSYMASSRYTCESSVGIIGILWIFAIVLSEKRPATRSLLLKKGMAGASVLIIVFLLMWSMKTEFEIAPYRGLTFQAAQEIVRHPEDFTDEELGVLQARSPEFIRNGTALLAKYNLSLYYSDAPS